MPGRSIDKDSNNCFLSEYAEEDEKRHVFLKESLDGLARILYSELSLYNDLISLLHKQRDSFPAGDILSFEEINKQQGTIILKIKTLEEARKSIASQIAKHFNFPQEEFTLAKLANLVDKPYCDLFIDFRQNILSIISELENLKESNAYLIQHSLHYVSGVLKIFASARCSQDHKYSNDGKLETNQKPGKYISGWG